jgi:hypothetical protein
MIMPPKVRKFALAVHLAFSVGWIGAVVAYLALGVSAVTSQDALVVRVAWIAMELTGWYVIVPLALAALLTGLVMSLGTKWGLFRHYWVLITLVLTVFATTILLLHMPDVSAITKVVRGADGADLAGGLGGDLLHSGAGLLVLLVIQVLNVYKPRGLTPYGWRKQHERRQGSPPIPPQRLTTTGNKGDPYMADLPSQPNANDGIGMEPDHGSATGIPWRLYVLLGIIVLHLTGDGLGGPHTP